MRRAILFAAVVVAVTAAGSAARDDGYMIKLRREKAGDKTEVTKTSAETVKYVVSSGGQNQTKEEKKGTKLVYTHEVIEWPADAKRATKLLRTYETAERTTDGKAGKLAYEGKKVLIEKKGAKYAFTVDGEELSAADAEDLDKEFNKDAEHPIQNEDFMPKGAVKLNEAWAVDAGPILKSLEARTPFKTDAEKSKVSGKLTKVYVKGGAQFGVIEVTMTLVTTGLKQGEQEQELKDGSKIAGKIDLDVCIDGSALDGTAGTAMTVDLKADLPDDGNLAITAGTNGKTTVKQVGKK